MDLDVGPVEEGAEVVDVALHLRLKGDAQVGFLQLVEFWNKGVCSFAVLQSTNGHINVHVRREGGPHSTMDSVLASHPAAPGSILGVSDGNLRRCRRD